MELTWKIHVLLLVIHFWKVVCSCISRLGVYWLTPVLQMNPRQHAVCSWASKGLSCSWVCCKHWKRWTTITGFKWRPRSLDYWWMGFPLIVCLQGYMLHTIKIPSNSNLNLNKDLSLSKNKHNPNKTKTKNTQAHKNSKEFNQQWIHPFSFFLEMGGLDSLLFTILELFCGESIFLVHSFSFQTQSKSCPAFLINRPFMLGRDRPVFRKPFCWEQCLKKDLNVFKSFHFSLLCIIYGMMYARHKCGCIVILSAF